MFPPVEGILELFDFERVKVSLLSGLENGSTYISSIALNFIYPLGLTTCGARQSEAT